MKDLPAKTDSVIAKETSQLLCAVKFLKNKKRNFDSVLSLCKKASLFEEVDGQYLVAFARDKKQVDLAMAFFEEIRVAAWKVIIFCDGRVITKKFALINMLSCASNCNRVKNKDAYCSETYDDPMDRFAKKGAFEFKFNLDGDPEPEEFEWTLPCKMLNGFISYSREELEDPIQKVEFASHERLTAVCPHFDLSRFKIREKPKRVSKPKKYW